MHRALLIFLHPRRAARLLNEKETEAEGLRHDRMCANTDIEELRCRLLSEIESNTGLRDEAECRRREISRLEKEAVADRALYAEQERKILELEEMFGRVNQISEAYEKRIASLKKRLAETRSALNRALRDADAELTPVPPADPSRYAPPPEPDPLPQEIEDTAEWYVSPPEL